MCIRDSNRTPHLDRTKSRVVNKRWQVEAFITDQCFDSCPFFEHTLWNSCLFLFWGPFLSNGMKVAAHSLHYSQWGSHPLLRLSYHDCLAHFVCFCYSGTFIAFSLSATWMWFLGGLFKKNLHPSMNEFWAVSAEYGMCKALHSSLCHM